MKKSLICLFIACGIYIGAIAQAVQPVGKMALKTFDFSKVHLLDSRWKQQQDETKAYYLCIPNDDLLKPFRRQAHLPTYGAVDMGGWYNLGTFNPFGQIISGLSRLYAGTGDEACRQKVNSLLAGWGACIGSMSNFINANPAAAHYAYEKLMCGLMDAYVYTGNKDALKYASIITDWAIKNLNRKDPQNVGEWYTLPENLYKAYLITGDRKYYDFATVWENTPFWDMVKNKEDIFKKERSYHAYSHLNTFNSAAMAYIAKGDDKYKQTIINAYDYFQDNQCYPTGGFGPNELLLPQTEFLKTTAIADHTFETQCGSWAIFKLCKYLVTITGDARFGDWIEKIMYNGVGASVPMSADGGVMYYSDYSPREAFKINMGIPWTCCTGTHPQAVSDYQQLIYFQSAKGIYVNLFIPSTVEWNNVTLTQNTRFPAKGQTSFKVDFMGTAKSGTFALHFRKPLWLTQSAVFLLNGKPVNAGTENGWYTINRKWQQGDEVIITLPVGFSFKSLVTTQEYPKMLMYGPVAMAIRSDNGDYPVGLLQSARPWKDFTAVAGEAVTWHFNNSGFLIRPFYDFKEKESYIILLDTTVQKQIANSRIVIKGDWHGSYKFAGEAGASITAKFTGSGFRVTGTRNDDAGKFSVMLDGKDIGEVDQYDKIRGTPFEYKLTGLKPGDHTVTIKVLGEKNKDSKGNIINYSTIEKIDKDI